MTKALFIGKFQPFHKGHLEAVKYILSRHDFLTIIIGSSQQSGTRENPFSYETRRQMIEQSLSSESITNYEIIPLRDTGSDDTWLESLLSKRGDFQLVYTNNPHVQQIFESAGYKVGNQPLFNREEYEGTKIREKIRNNGHWQGMVPQPASEIINSAKPQSLKRKKHRRCHVQNE